MFLFALVVLLAISYILIVAELAREYDECEFLRRMAAEMYQLSRCHLLSSPASIAMHSQMQGTLVENGKLILTISYSKNFVREKHDYIQHSVRPLDSKV